MFSRRLAICSFVFFTASVAHAQSDFSGTYTGTYHLMIGVGSCAKVSSGAASLSVSQSGTSASASGLLQKVTVVQNRTSCATSVFDVPLQFTGTVSGSTLTATDRTTNATVTLTLNGDTIFGSVSSPDTGDNNPVNGSITVSRSGTTGSTDNFSGTWTGSVGSAAALPCGGASNATYAATANLTASGGVVNGTVTVSNGLCTGGPTFTVPVINATLVAPNEFVAEFTGSGITNGVVVGISAGSGLLAIGIGFTTGANQDIVVSGLLTGGSGPQQPLAISSFVASPPTIRAGQSTTLSWSAQGATGVSIDNNVGHFGAFGSTTVSPKTTTTYTLTATQGTNTATASVTVTVLTGAIVNVTALPSAMLQPAGSGGATTTYAVTNSGSDPASITLTQDGPPFFTQSPASFALAAGATQVVTITGLAEPPGAYEGHSIGSVTAGSTSLAGFQVPVKLLSAAPPAGAVFAAPPEPRVDVAAPPGTSPSGSVKFTNSGNATLTGILTSDVPWIIPQSGPVTIAPGATATFSFTIDRTKRPDSAAPIGSIEGNIILSFLPGSGSTFAKHPLDNTTSLPSVSLVKVVDTAQPTVTTTGIPALATGEVALFVAGAGHVTGTGGTQFVSDVNVLNAQGSRAVDDLKMYYTSSTGTASSAKAASIPSVPGQVSVSVADVVKNVFNGSSNEVGTVQLRSKDADKLAVAATVLTPNNPNGIFGNTIPVFRSDRATDANNTLVLTGLRKDATTHTNLYIQETAGLLATVQIDFLGSNGSTISSQPVTVDPFKLQQLVNVVPNGAVAAVLTNTSTAGGKIAAYATPLDEVSSDTWAIADWSKQLGYSGSDAVIIPIAGTVHGANSTFYRTDVSITNRGTSAGSGTLRYISRTGTTTDKPVALDPKQTSVINDVIGTMFNVTDDSTGFLMFTPASGSSFAVSSRTFTTTGSGAATFGTGVPVVAAASALRTGGARPIAGLSDAARTTVVNKQPGTFRTNFALMETTGKPVTVRVTFRFTFPAGAKAQGVGSASRDYSLNANQFVMLNSIAGEILGPARLQFGDLSNVEADFQVVDGIGGVVLFTSSVDNRTGDSILRTE